MIGNCVLSGKYNMLGSVYEKDTLHNANTGQVKAVYKRKRQVPMVARGLSNLRGKDSGTMQDIGNKLADYHYIRIKTMEYIKEGSIITRIIDAGGYLYLSDRIQFVVLGVTPTYDPFGSFLEYDMIANKSEVTVGLSDSCDESDMSVDETSLVDVI